MHFLRKNDVPHTVGSVSTNTKKCHTDNRTAGSRDRYGHTDRIIETLCSQSRKGAARHKGGGSNGDAASGERRGERRRGVGRRTVGESGET